MINTMEDDDKIITKIERFHDDHPYAIAGIISTLFMAFVLFYTPSMQVADEDDFMFNENIPIINIDTVRTPKRMVKKVFSADKGDISESDDVKRARGSSNDANAIDLTSEFGWSPPKPRSGLKKYYPKFAREKNVTAKVGTSLVVAANGRIKKVRIEYVKLNKKFPRDIEKELKRGFLMAANKTLMGALFTPPVFQGKNRPVVSLFTLRFTLNN